MELGSQIMAWGVPVAFISVWIYATVQGIRLWRLTAKREERAAAQREALVHYVLPLHPNCRCNVHVNNVDELGAWVERQMGASDDK